MKKLGDLKELDEGTKDKEDICLLLKKCGTKRVLAIYSLTYQRLNYEVGQWRRS
jgi:hypothetical protein